MKNLVKKTLTKNLFKLINIKNYFILHSFRNYYYSQSGEDLISAKLFTKKNKGFYVDVGAYHPKHYSNTYLFHKKGWGGINIDPNKNSIGLFKKYRKKDINLNYGISTKDGFLKYYRFSHPSCNTFSKTQADKLKNKKWIKFLGIEKIRCLTLKEVLDKYLTKGQNIDLLNIDVEGLDMEVLLSNNWNVYKPKVIIIESPKFDPSKPESSNIFNFLTKKIYKLHAFTGLSLIFVLKD